MDRAGTGEARTHSLGIALVTCSAAVFGLAGVLTKSIDADPLTINCWRGLVGALLITAYVFWRRSREVAPRPLRLGWRGWLMAVVGALGQYRLHRSLQEHLCRQCRDHLRDCSLRCRPSRLASGARRYTPANHACGSPVAFRRRPHGVFRHWDRPALRRRAGSADDAGQRALHGPDPQIPRHAGGLGRRGVGISAVRARLVRHRSPGRTRRATRSCSRASACPSPSPPCCGPKARGSSPPPRPGC